MCDFLEQSQSDEFSTEYEEWSNWKDSIDPAFETLKINLPDTCECDSCEDMKCGDNCPAPIETDVPF